MIFLGSRSGENFWGCPEKSGNYLEGLEGMLQHSWWVLDVLCKYLSIYEMIVQNEEFLNDLGAFLDSRGKKLRYFVPLASLAFNL